MALSHYQCVDEFHRVFGHPRPGTPQHNIFENQKLVNMRLSLIREEHREFTEGIATSNIVEVLDALSDILYVVHGMGIVFGIDLGRTENDDFDTNTPNVRLFDNMELVNTRQTMLSDSITALNTACADKNFDLVERCLVNLLYVTYETARLFDLPIDRSFRLVHDNNMSKLCRSEEDAIASVIHYANNPEFKDVIVNYRQSTDGKYYVMFNDTPGHPQNGKILKAHTWREPDFTPLVYPNQPQLSVESQQ